MIYKILTSPFWLIFDITLIFIFVILKKFFTKIIGYAGEHWVKQELKKLSKDEYQIINDVMISVNNKTFQIDHLVVSKYGIFVIETKQYNGYFTGNKYDKKWVGHSKKKKYYYTNPIRQNYGHVKSVCELLNLDETKVFNIVCISSNAKLNIQHDGELTTILTIIEKICSYNNVIIENPNFYYQKIKENNITSKKLRKQHIKNIKKNIDKFDNNMCPKCGGKLIERSGSYGSFMGCSNYPKCKYTRRLN